MRYVYQGWKQGEVVASTCLSPDREDATQEMQDAISMRPDLKRSFMHATISVEPSEPLSAEQWQEVAHRYMAHMGYEACPYIAIQHHDTDHHHIHIVSSRVGMDAQLVSDSFEYKRAEVFARKMEVELGLRQLTCSWEQDRRAPAQREYHQELRLEEGSARHMIGQALATVGPKPELSQWVEDLSKLGVDVRPRLSSDQERVIGISFSYEGVHIAGSRVDKSASWGRLKDQFNEEGERELILWSKLEQTRHERTPEARSTPVVSNEDVARKDDASPHRSEASSGPPKRTPGGEERAALTQIEAQGPERQGTSASPQALSTTAAHLTSRPDALEGSERTQNKAQDTGQEEPKGPSLVRASLNAFEREQLHRMLLKADWSHGYQAWQDSLKAQGIEAIPRVSASDQSQVRGMYFEYQGQLIPGSKVGKPYSFEGIQKQLGRYEGARDAQAFSQMEVAGLGRVKASPEVPQEGPKPEPRLCDQLRPISMHPVLKRFEKHDEKQPVFEAKAGDGYMSSSELSAFYQQRQQVWLRAQGVRGEGTLVGQDIMLKEGRHALVVDAQHRVVMVPYQEAFETLRGQNVMLDRGALVELKAYQAQLERAQHAQAEVAQRTQVHPSPSMSVEGTSPATSTGVKAPALKAVTPDEAQPKQELKVAPVYPVRPIEGESSPTLAGEPRSTPSANLSSVPSPSLKSSETLETYGSTQGTGALTPPQGPPQESLTPPKTPAVYPVRPIQEMGSTTPSSTQDRGSAPQHTARSEAQALSASLPQEPTRQAAPEQAVYTAPGSKEGVPQLPVHPQPPLIVSSTRPQAKVEELRVCERRGVKMQEAFLQTLDRAGQSPIELKADTGLVNIKAFVSYQQAKGQPWARLAEQEPGSLKAVSVLPRALDAKDGRFAVLVDEDHKVYVAALKPADEIALGRELNASDLEQWRRLDAQLERRSQEALSPPLQEKLPVAQLMTPGKLMKEDQGRECDRIQPVSRHESLKHFEALAQPGEKAAVTVRGPDNQLVELETFIKNQNARGERWKMLEEQRLPERATLMGKDLVTAQGRYSVAVTKDHEIVLMKHLPAHEQLRQQDVAFVPNDRGQVRLRPAPERALEPQTTSLEQQAQAKLTQARLEQQTRQQTSTPSASKLEVEKELPSLKAKLEQLKSEGHAARVLYPNQEVKGSVTKYGVATKEGNFAIIQTPTRELVLVPHQSELDQLRGKEVEVTRKAGSTLEIKDMTPKLDRGRDR